MTYLPYLILFMATEFLQPALIDTKAYHVKKIKDKELIVTGKGDSPLWKQANELSDFVYPWETEQPPYTLFKALHTQDWLYCLYDVKDDNINVYVNTNDKSEVVHSDRVEIFFRKDDRMSPYYGLELDPLARVLDYEAEYHRKFNDQWTWPAGQLIVKSSRRKDGYTVEIAIQKKSLLELGVLNGNRIEAGLFRGNCVEIDLKEDKKIKWISWVKPASETPDFHVPSAFGVLMLEP